MARPPTRFFPYQCLLVTLCSPLVLPLPTELPSEACPPQSSASMKPSTIEPSFLDLSSPMLYL
jgi:hypothetical protein